MMRSLAVLAIAAVVAGCGGGKTAAAPPRVYQQALPTGCCRDRPGHLPGGCAPWSSSSTQCRVQGCAWVASRSCPTDPPAGKP